MKILADVLMHRNLGVRPVTLVGFSLGARVIYYCLLELSKAKAYGLIQDVYLYGSPVVVKKKEYEMVRSVVAGRFLNGFLRNDWILGYLFRATSGGLGRVAGLRPIEGIHGVENFDCTETVDGHMRYREAMPKLLREVDWSVTSDHFNEIEDPDPLKHRERQRELIDELEEAKRKANEGKGGKKSRFGIFGRSSQGKKEEWEIYDDHSQSNPATAQETSRSALFDVDEILRELESDGIEVKQLQSTLPPLIARSMSDRGLPTEESSKAELSHLRRKLSQDCTSSTPNLHDASGFRNESEKGWASEEVTMSFETDYARHNDAPPSYESESDGGQRPASPGSFEALPEENVTMTFA